MGVQSAAVRRLKLPGIATAYITGTITSLFSGLVHHWRAPQDDQQPASDDLASLAKPGMKPALILQAEVFLSYLIAAVGGAAPLLAIRRRGGPIDRDRRRGCFAGPPGSALIGP